MKLQVVRRSLNGDAAATMNRKISSRFETTAQARRRIGDSKATFPKSKNYVQTRLYLFVLAFLLSGFTDSSPIFLKRDKFEGENPSIAIA